jgi:hypothetical protein
MLHEYVGGVKVPKDYDQHYSEWQTADDSRCWSKNGDGEVRLPRKRIASHCPQYNKAYLCEPHGNAYPDAFCPLLKDPAFKFEYGYNSTIRDIVAQREIAYKVRTISKRRIPCDKAYLIGLKLTSQQRGLWFLRLLGPKVVGIEEVEHISGINRKDFNNVLFGRQRPDGYRVGGAANKVEKILRHAGLDKTTIEAFCQEAFRVGLLEFKHPEWYRQAVKRIHQVKLVDCEFPVWIAEDDIEDVWGYKNVTHYDVQKDVKAGRSNLSGGQYKDVYVDDSKDDTEWESGRERTGDDPEKKAKRATDDPT